MTGVMTNSFTSTTERFPFRLLPATLAIGLILAGCSLAAQDVKWWPDTFFKGYSRSVKGGGFQYHSPQPDVTSSLLVRALDSLQFIEWETAPVPQDFSGKQARFIWIFGIVDGLTTPFYDRLIGRRIPGLGIGSTALAIVLVGVFARNVIGRRAAHDARRGRALFIDQPLRAGEQPRESFAQAVHRTPFR